ncbi:MAG TPA: hydroxyacid dehydrogenase [Xanthobacteraceae bacterium]|nr:hydroxyacid dehydrogenase [Xanthobacteraceae bacterium]
MTTNKKRLLVPQSMSPAAWAILQARPDIDTIGFPATIQARDLLALIQHHAPVQGIALGVTKFGDPELDAAQDMQVVARIGVGYDAVDVEALTRRKIPLMVTDIANSPSVAEAALFMMMALAKRGAEMDAMVRTNRWSERLRSPPYDLYGKTVLIVGFGRIGTRVAARCLAMEMSVLVYDPYRSAADISAANCEPVTDLNAATARADFITLHCPKTAETTDLFGAERLMRMKPSAYLINTARGGIINEQALFNALQQGQLAGAGLDVFDQEPTPIDNPLLALPNVICAPHVAGVTREAYDRMAQQTAHNLLSVLDGAPSRIHVVNQIVLD